MTVQINRQQTWNGIRTHVLAIWLLLHLKLIVTKNLCFSKMGVYAMSQNIRSTSHSSTEGLSSLISTTTVQCIEQNHPDSTLRRNKHDDNSKMLIVYYS